MTLTLELLLSSILILYSISIVTGIPTTEKAVTQNDSKEINRNSIRIPTNITSLKTTNKEKNKSKMGTGNVNYIKNGKTPTKVLETKQHYNGDYYQGERLHKKKKKFRKAIMKLLLIGTILKAKLELFLKVIATAMQFKFFVVALGGLIINVVRLYLDLRRGQQPQKVIYYEHASHQHHYDEHDDGWNSSGYWKRSMQENEDLLKRN